MSSSSIEFTKIIEKIEIDGHGNANFTREYNICNNSDTELALNSLPPFSARFHYPLIAWNVTLKEKFYNPVTGKDERIRELPLKSGEWGDPEVKWQLSKPSLLSNENYSFVLCWEFRQFVTNVGDQHWFYYDYGELQIVPYELTVCLPDRQRLLDNAYPQNFEKALRRLILPLWDIQHNSNLVLDRDEHQGQLLLKYNARISLNNPLNIWVFYWLKLPRWIGFILGLIVGIAGDLVASYIWEHFLRGIFIKP